MKRDYREKTVKGLIIDVTKPFPKKCDVTVRMTSDRLGQSLSLQAFNVMLEIPLESVTEIIKVSGKEQNDNT